MPPRVVWRATAVVAGGVRTVAAGSVCATAGDRQSGAHYGPVQMGRDGGKARQWGAMSATHIEMRCIIRFCAYAWFTTEFQRSSTIVLDTITKPCIIAHTSRSSTIIPSETETSNSWRRP